MNETKENIKFEFLLTPIIVVAIFVYERSPCKGVDVSGIHRSMFNFINFVVDGEPRAKAWVYFMIKYTQQNKVTKKQKQKEQITKEKKTCGFFLKYC